MGQNFEGGSDGVCGVPDVVTCEAFGRGCDAHSGVEGGEVQEVGAETGGTGAGIAPKAPDDGRMSVFDTPMWKSFARDSLMGEVPCVMNGKNVGLGGNMNLWHLRDAQLGSQGSRDQGSVWPLELVGLRNHEGLLSSLVRRSWIQGPEPLELNKFHVRDWQLHVQRDHLPYRKDCRTCIERASGKPHRRVTHPSAYCLFIDTAGPFRNVGAGGYNKYLLVGCYRHPKLPGTNPEEELAKATEEADVLPRPDEGDDWLGEDKEAAAGGKILRRWNLKVALVSLIQENLFVTLKRQLRIRRSRR